MLQFSFIISIVNDLCSYVGYYIGIDLQLFPFLFPNFQIGRVRLNFSCLVQSHDTASAAEPEIIISHLKFCTCLWTFSVKQCNDQAVRLVPWQSISPCPYPAVAFNSPQFQVAHWNCNGIAVHLNLPFEIQPSGSLLPSSSWAEIWVKQVLDLAANKCPKLCLTDSLQRSRGIPLELARWFS